MAEDRAGIEALREFLETELGKWSLNHGAQDRHFLAVGLANAIVNRGPAPPPPKVTEELRVAIKVAIGALRNYAMELRHPQRAVQAADELEAAWRAASSGEA